jgi:hypothetical protein
MSEDWPSTLNLLLMFSAYFKILNSTKTNNSVHQSFVVCSIVEPSLPSLYVAVHGRTLRPFSNTAETEATHKITRHKLWICSFLLSYIPSCFILSQLNSLVFYYINIWIPENCIKCQDGDSATQLTRPGITNCLGVTDPFLTSINSVVPQRMQL